ncbi:MAG: helix-turn-helix transcriptional regulator [Bacillota bacterium]
MIDLAQLRKTRGLTQQDLAQRVGISQPFLSQLERGQQKLSGKSAQKLGAIFGIEPDALMRNHEEFRVLAMWIDILVDVAAYDPEDWAFELFHAEYSPALGALHAALEAAGGDEKAHPRLEWAVRRIKENLGVVFRWARLLRVPGHEVPPEELKRKRDALSKQAIVHLRKQIKESREHKLEEIRARFTECFKEPSGE